MAGPLDFLTSDDAQMGLAMLAAGGPSTTPMSFGQRLASGAQQAQAMKDARAERTLKQLLTNAQIQHLQAETAQQTGLMGAANNVFGGAPSAAGGGVAAPPQAGLLAPDGQSAPAAQGAPAGLMAGPGGGMAPTAQPQPVQQPGSLRGVPLGKISMLLAMGGKDLTEQWKLENIGTPIQPGWIRMADGSMQYTGDPSKGLDTAGRMTPGYLTDQTALTAATKGAEATAGAKYAPGEPYIDTDKNSPTYMQKVLPSRLQQFGGGAGPAAGPAPAAPARALIGPGYAGGSSAAAAGGQMEILGQELTKTQQTLAAAQQSGDAAGAARAQADIASIQREMGRLPKSAGAPLIGPGAGAARAPAANVVELSPQQQAENAATAEKLKLGVQTEAAAAQGYQQQVGKQQAERRDSIMKAGQAADNNIAKLNQIGDLLAQHDGGKLSERAMDIASTANSLGFKIDKTLPNKEAASMLARGMALELRNPAGGAGMPGAMSDDDRRYLASMTPNISQSAQGRKQVIESGIAVENRNQQVADFARKYESKYGRLDNGFDQQLTAWAKVNPLFGSRK